MSAGQCRIDPVTGIAGAIWSGWIGSAGNGLASGVLVSGSALRAMVASQVEAIASGIGTGGGDHSTLLAWANGSSSGNYVKGSAASSGSFASGAVVGCDEGGTITFTTGANTGTGALWSIYFGTGYAVAPAGTVQAADSATAGVMFNFQTYVTTTTSGLTFNVNSPLSNATYKWHWLVKGGV